MYYDFFFYPLLSQGKFYTWPHTYIIIFWSPTEFQSDSIKQNSNVYFRKKQIFTIDSGSYCIACNCLHYCWCLQLKNKWHEMSNENGSWHKCAQHDNDLQMMWAKTCGDIDISQLNMKPTEIFTAHAITLRQEPWVPLKFQSMKCKKNNNNKCL